MALGPCEPTTALIDIYSYPSFFFYQQWGSAELHAELKLCAMLVVAEA